ncbi:uncharacterized protein LOC143125406 isoform X10 [Alosa pseudoharengus]|uniref:uncharacterized protein LOC143125406 isoform X10 n=1 Tax=Alosa pseudoharengus TaxID=34774 RepID=UPI003F8A6038
MCSAKRMKTSVSLLTILAVATQGFIVQGPSAPLSAPRGGSIVLPCSVEPPLPLEELEVQWSRKYSDELVNLFHEGEERPESQSNDYRGKVHFFSEEFANGNYSILLTNLEPMHAGFYSCVVFYHDQKNETHMEIQELGELSSQMIFAFMLMGLGAVVAFLTSILFQHYLLKKVEGKAALLFHSCHMIAPNVLLFLGTAVIGADVLDIYSTHYYNDPIVKHTLSITTINLMRILVLFKVCPHLDTFPELLRTIVTTLSMPIASLVFGIVSALVIHLKKMSAEQSQSLSNSSSFVAVAYAIQISLLVLHTMFFYWIFHVPMQVYLGDTGFIFFLSFACIFQRKIQPLAKYDIFVYEFGAVVLPIFHAIYLSVVGFQLSMYVCIAVFRPVEIIPLALIIPAESIFLILWICPQTRYHLQRKTVYSYRTLLNMNTIWSDHYRAMKIDLPQMSKVMDETEAVV